MNITTTARRISLAVAATSTMLAGVAAFSGSASAQGAHPNGYSPVETCTSMVGTVTLNPGLRKKAQTETAVITGTLDGCNFEGTAQPGQGTFTAVISGSASTTAGSLGGTYNINWPASSGLNPSNGSIVVSNSVQGSYRMGGTDTGGAFTGALLQGAYLVSGTQGTGAKHNPITQQSFVNTAPLQMLVNFG